MAVAACRYVRIHPPTSLCAYFKNDTLRNYFSSSVPLLEYRQITNVVLHINLVPDLEIDEVLAPSRRLVAALSSLLTARKYSEPSATNNLLVTCSTIFVSEIVQNRMRGTDDISLGVTCSLIIVSSYGLPIVYRCTTRPLRHSQLSQCDKQKQCSPSILPPIWISAYFGSCLGLGVLVKLMLQIFSLV